MKLFRAISEEERVDFEMRENKFAIAKNTLEAKQFFKTKKAVIEFVKFSIVRDFSPPYKFVHEIELDDDCLSRILFDEQDLDFNRAITIHENYLTEFNKCIKFVTQHEITNYIYD